jgi:hypothetical protein
LVVDGVEDDLYGFVEVAEDFLFGGVGGGGEFLGSVADVAGVGDFGADVVVEIAG